MLVILDIKAGKYGGIKVYTPDDECVLGLYSGNPEKDYNRAILYIANLDHNEKIYTDLSFKDIHEYAPGYIWDETLECIVKDEQQTRGS